MFINFWYPAEQSENVTTEPLKVQMLGLQFVLWRDEAGRARCIANTWIDARGAKKYKLLLNPALIKAGFNEVVKDAHDAVD